jgi:hypothetical protein
MSILFLAPVPLNQNPLPMAVYPAVPLPTSVLVRRTIPAARTPNIMVTFVAVIAINPNVASVRRIAADFHHRRRWSNANPHLR